MVYSINLYHSSPVLWQWPIFRCPSHWVGMALDRIPSWRVKSVTNKYVRQTGTCKLPLRPAFKSIPECSEWKSFQMNVCWSLPCFFSMNCTSQHSQALLSRLLWEGTEGGGQKGNLPLTRWQPFPTSSPPFLSKGKAPIWIQVISLLLILQKGEITTDQNRRKINSNSKRTCKKYDSEETAAGLWGFCCSGGFGFKLHLVNIA